jgi:hypothetical protein
MIVKNEAHIIRDTLENLCKYINFSYYVISDTGSTDGTQLIIKNFFESKKINGEIYQDTWKDFGYNRSLALKYAFNKTQYVFIFDADDSIFGDFNLPSELNYDSYYLKFGIDVTYKRILLVNNRLEWNFIGVLHEYINCITKKNVSNSFIDGNYFIESGRTGNRNKDPEKYINDAIILEKAYDEEHEKSSLKLRYSFYCAQSYRDADDKENAIKWYKKRIELKGWEQEVYFSYYSIGKLYYELNEIEKAIYYWILSYETDKDRYESIYEIISHFRKINNSYLAYKYYLMIENFNPNLNDKLFVYHPIYTFLLNYELSIIFFNIKKYNEGITTFKKLFLIDDIYPDVKLHLLEIFLYYVDYLSNDLIIYEYFFNFIKNIYLLINKFDNKYIEIIQKIVNKFTSIHDTFNINDIKYNIKNKLQNNNINVFFSITTCKRYDLFVKTINSFLLCCKDINLIDYFFCIDDNSTNDDRKNMLIEYPFFKYYFKKEFEKGHLTSMNIIWNKLNELKPKYWIHIEDDWVFIKPFNYIKTSIDFLEKYRKDNIHQLLFNKNYAEIINDYDFVGGIKLDNDFLLHIKDEKNLYGKNCAYWPHYSFRPSICIVDTILKLGNFDSPNIFFEMDYANKYYNNGYKSAFYNEITSIHIGKLTTEKSSDKNNAYSLNNISQFNNNLIVGFYVDSTYNYNISKIIFNYAKYNKNILNNVTYIFIPHILDNNIKNIFTNLNLIEYNSNENIELLITKLNINYIYLINIENNFYFKNCTNIIHTLNKIEYNNDINKNIINITFFDYNNKNNIEPIIEKENENNKYKFNISNSDIIIGIFNIKSFLSINYYKNIILNILDKNPNIYFIINSSPLFEIHNRIIYIDESIFDKNKFINTCHIFINGYFNNDYELFDILSLNKKIICASDKIINSNNNIILYNNQNSFNEILLNIENIINNNIEYSYSPYDIINKFNSILNNKKIHFVYINQINNDNKNLENYSYFKKIDCDTQKYNTLIKNLFYKNTFNNNKIIINNILTHYILWKYTKNNNLYDYLVILEYNINIENIITIINNLINNNDFDILLLKNTFDNNDIINYTNDNLKVNKIDNNNINININFFTYVINKNCLNKIFEYINLNSITDNFINNIFKHIDSLKILETDNIIFKLDKNIINKIQNENENNNINCNILDNNIFLKNEYIYIENLDHYGDDIIFLNNANGNINDLKYYFEQNDESIAFNTYGYFKININLDTLISLNNDKHGLYIHIDRYNKKYNTNIIKKIYNDEKLKNIILKNDNNKFINNIILENKVDNNIQNKVENNKNKLEENEDEDNKNKDDTKYICFSNKIYKLNQFDFKKNENISNLFKYIKNINNCVAFSTDGSLKNYINISNLEYSDKYNTIIDINKYININYTDFIEKTSYIKIINNYLFIQNLDYNDNNDYINFNNNYSINEIINIANNDINIIAFNKYGFFKNKFNINNLVKNKDSNNNGIFIKIDKLISDNQYLKLNDINTSDIEYKCENCDLQTLIINIEKGDYIGFTSNGFLKKDINLENILNIHSIYNNYLCINVKKYINFKINNKKYIKIKLICDWTDSEKLCYQINKMTKGSLLWNNIKFVYDDNLIDYFIIFNNIYKDTYYEPSKTIIFINNDENYENKYESNILKNKFMKIIKSNINENYYFWKINKTYIELVYETFEKKYNNFFINLSNKYENKIEICNLIKYIKNNDNNILDIYFNHNIYDNLLITKYKYCIIIQEDEDYNIIKLLHNIFDVLLSECLCFYYGTSDIFNYIDEDAIIKIDLNNITETYDILKKSINENIFSKKIDFIKKQKIKILNNYNICSTIEKIVSE